MIWIKATPPLCREIDAPEELKGLAAKSNSMVDAKVADKRSQVAEDEGAGTATGTLDALALLKEKLALQNHICDLLEAIADGLPHQFDSEPALISASILEAETISHIRFEEEALFPLLRQRADKDSPLHLALACLESEHERDSVAVSEIVDGLTTAIADGSMRNADMLGYMLRGFFESQRRHIAWERNVLLPMAETVLIAQDMDEMRRWLAQRDHPRSCRQSRLAIQQARDALASGRNGPDDDGGKLH